MSRSLRLAAICSGNICRSPMAAALLRREAERRGLKAVVISAGTLGLVNRPAAEHARAASAEIGLSLDAHRSQSAAPGLLRHADAILVMERHHALELIRREPSLAKKIVAIWRFVPTGPGGAPLEGIEDPVRGTLTDFRLCRDQLEGAIQAWLDQRAPVGWS